MAEVDWKEVFQFCLERKNSISPEDQKQLTRSLLGLNLSLLAGVVSALATHHFVFRLPAAQTSPPLLKFNIGAFCLTVPLLFWVYVGVRRIMKPTFLTVYEKYNSPVKP
jgi:hypothetical protein